MDERIKKIDTPEKCGIFKKNALRKGREDLANEATLRAIELRAESYGAKSQTEKEVLQAIYAYEEVSSKNRGRKIRANRTWPMVKEHGIIAAAERAVNRAQETQGYKTLVEMGLQEFAFEAVILRHKKYFSEDAVKISEERISQWTQA